MSYAKIEVTLKGTTYRTTVPSSASVVLLSALFNYGERALLEIGRGEEAATLFSMREGKRLKDALENARADAERTAKQQKLNAEETKALIDRRLKETDTRLERELNVALWQTLENNNVVRSRVAKRLKEVFRFAEPCPLPDEIVFWYSESDNGILLDEQDLMNLFGAVVEPITKEIQKQAQENAIAPAESLNGLSDVEIVDPAARVQQLEEELARLREA